jgi:hypothetical protein
VSSRLDDVMTALAALFAGLPALAGVVVSDGPPLDGMGSPDFVLVGDDGLPDSTAEITVEQEWADLACTRRHETGEVICSALSQTGDTDMQARRDRAFALFAACEAAVLADQTLGGVVLSSQLARAGARQFQNSAGAAVVVPFVVTYRAIV